MDTLQRLRFWITSFPIWIVLADLIYIIVSNIRNDLIIPKTIPTTETITHIPAETAINWIQVSMGITMALLAIWALFSVHHLNRRVILRKHTPTNGFLAFSCYLAIFLTVPTIWEFFWVIVSILQKKLVFYPSAEYIIVALCLPLIFTLTIKRLWDNHQLPKQTQD